MDWFCWVWFLKFESIVFVARFGNFLATEQVHKWAFPLIWVLFQTGSKSEITGNLACVCLHSVNSADEHSGTPHPYMPVDEVPVVLRILWTCRSSCAEFMFIAFWDLVLWAWPSSLKLCHQLRWEEHIEHNLFPHDIVFKWTWWRTCTRRNVPVLETTDACLLILAAFASSEVHCFCSICYHIDPDTSVLEETAWIIWHAD